MSSTSAFVGRAREMESLCAMLNAACAGTGGVALLAGEPGIGKTRTAEELDTVARQRGAHVLWGRCYEGEGAPAFWPWMQALRSYIRTSDADALRAALGPGAAEVAQLIPEARARLPDLPEPPLLEPAQARFRLFESVTTFLCSTSTVQPVVLILDDLHWADVPSLLLLQFLARELGDSHLLVAGTYRDTEIHPDHPLTRTLGELVREPVTARFHLGGLGEGDLARMIEHLTGCPPPAPLVSALYRATDGNPFFAAEVVRFMVAEGRLPHSDGVVPPVPIAPSVRDAVGQRLGRLSAACNRVLTIAAVIGREFGLNALGQVSELAGERLLEALEEAETARVVAAVPGAPGRYGFVHALIRESLYEELPTTRRVRLHRQVGEALERLSGGQPDAHLTELAHHFLQAAPGGVAGKAFDYARRAAEQATALLAYEESARLYQLALGALQLAEPVDEAQRCDLLLALAAALSAAGDVVQARQTYEHAATSARVVASPERLALAVLRLADPLVPPDKLAALGGWLQEAERKLDPGDSPLRARLLAQLAVYGQPSRSSAERAALSREAVAMARRLGDVDTLIHALFNQHIALWAPDNIEERLAIAGELTSLEAASGGGSDHGLRRAGNGVYVRLCALLDRGEIAEADLELETYVRLAEQSRRQYPLSEATTLRALRALLAGRFAEVEQLAGELRRLARRAGSVNGLLAVAWLMFMVRREQGRLQELEPEVAAIAKRSGTNPLSLSIVVLFYQELGREAEARAAFEALVADDFARLPGASQRLMSVAVLAEASAAFGDAGHAAPLYRMLRPFAGLNLVAPGPVTCPAVCYGAADRYLGLLAATMGRCDEAARHFEDALAINARMGARPLTAHTEHDYAAMLAARGGPGDRERALELLEGALQTARELGMTRLAERVLALQATASPRSAAPAYPDHLTEREVDVLRLLARGLSSKEIAAALVVSVRTVDNHIANAYAKIRARNRAEATAYALRHALA